jgi:archaellum component FlaC
MEIVGTIASVIAALAAIMTLRFTIRHSKGNIRRRIEKRQRKIREIENQLVNLYGLDRGRCHPITPLDSEIERLQTEIMELQKDL